MRWRKTLPCRHIAWRMRVGRPRASCPVAGLAWLIVWRLPEQTPLRTGDDGEQGLEGPQQLRHALVPLIVVGVIEDGGTIPVLVERGIQRLLQGGAVAERHDAAEFLAAHHFGVAADIGGDDRQAAGHGFEKDVGPAFVAGGEHEDVGRRQRPLEFVRRQRAEKMHALDQPQPRHLGVEFGAHVAFRAGAADDEVVQIRVMLRAAPAGSR